jgi:trigger factor
LSVEIVEVSGCRRNLVVEVPADVVEAEVQRLARQYAARARIPGFRPGKVPLGIVLSRFGAELRNDATQDLIHRYWRSAVEEHELHPLTEPTVEQLEGSAGTPMKFTVSFEILPRIDAHDYRGATATVAPAPVEEAEVDRALDELRERHAEYVPVEDREIRDGDHATLTVDGEFEGGEKPVHEEGVVCIVGSPRTNQAFSENLIGAKVGEERAFEVSYPGDYHRKRYAGKKVRYRARVDEIKEKVLPQLSDDFAKDIGEAESLADLRVAVRKQLEQEAEAAADRKAKETVIDTIVRRHSFDLPESLVHEELQHHASRIAEGLARQGIDVNQVALDWKKMFEQERPAAEAAVRRTLVLDAIARQEHIEATEADVEQELGQIAEGARKSPAAIRAQLEKNKRFQGFKDHLRRKKALDFVLSNATISRG